MAKKLKLLLIPLLVLGLLGAKTTPALAGIDIWPFNDLWNKIKCVADINCTVRAAAVAAQNFIIKTTVGDDLEALTAADIEQMKRGEWDKGLAAAMGKIGSTAYAAPPPMRLADFVKAELSDNILNSQAQATVGTTVLEPIIPFWSGMRNVAYGLFLIVMIAIGIMIILQHSISPRVVVTFTNSLPRILLGLVLITFSFPLIAFVVDLVAVFGSNVIVGIMGNILPATLGSQIPAGGAASLVSGFTTMLIGFTLDAISFALGGALAALTIGIILILAGLVLFGLSIIRLFTSYAWIVVLTIFSPLLLLFGSLPGQEGVSTDLLKKLVAKVLVFPVILLFYILSFYFAITGVAPATFGFITGGSIPQLLGDVVFFRFIGPLVALVLLAACFKAPSMIEEALGIDKPRRKK